MYECKYCGKVLDCHHRREKNVLDNSPIIKMTNQQKDKAQIRRAEVAYKEVIELYGSFKAENQKLKTQVAEMREALSWLVRLKKHKDLERDIESYKIDKPKAWAKAKEVLEKHKESE